MKFIPVVQPRECGACTLCCKVLGVEELEKRENVWCRHAKRPNGCTIYEDRPQTCRTFRCLWLDGKLQDDCRPDRIHAVLTTTEDGAALVIHEDSGWPGHARVALKPLIDDIVGATNGFVLLYARGVPEIIAAPHIKARLTIEQVTPGKFNIKDSRQRFKTS